MVQPEQSLLARLYACYARAMSALGIVLMSVIVTVMGVQVFFRYVLNNSIIWAEELSGYMLVLISFLLLGVAYQKGEMMNVEFLMGRLAPRLRAALNIPIHLAITTFLAVLCFYCYKFALLNRSASIPALDFIVSSITGENRTVVVSRFWLYLMLPIGLGLLALHVLAAALRDLMVALGMRAPRSVLPPELSGLHEGNT